MFDNGRSRLSSSPSQAVGGASLCFVLLIVLVSWFSQADAHDIYMTLKNRAGMSCCNDRECRPAVYRFTPAGVQMLVDGEWIVVPPETIQYRTLEGDGGETAGGHWCGLTNYGVVTYCAILPPSSASR
jgi:hypothetical protein